ncbi:MAG: radical SAM protein [Akkermansia sp.]|nr:radical SAM protein [Akkermansia sp.]
MEENLTLTLCLTHDCNLRCRYCYAGRKYAHAMSRETAEKALNLALAEAQSTGRNLDISFFGGEPLLEWPLLQHCCDWIQQKAEGSSTRIRFGITTNGTLLTQDKLEWMAGRDFLVGLSIDGSPDMHNTNRRFADGRDSHEQVAEALELIADTPRLRRKVICVVNPANCIHLRSGVLWLHGHYRGPIGLNFDYWSEWTDEQFATLSQQLELVARDVANSYRIGHAIQLECLENKILTHLHGRKENCLHCRIGEREIAVSVDGNFFPCSRMVGDGDSPDICFGNVNNGIDRARQNYIIATRGNATPECKLCAWRHRCLNTCGCTNYAASGHINRVSPFLCNLQQHLIRLADEMAEALYREQNPAFLQRFYGAAK